MNGQDGVDGLLMFVVSAVHVFSHVVIITFIAFSLSLPHTHTRTHIRTHAHTHTQSKFGVCKN